jgi:hypothetical protein
VTCGEGIGQEMLLIAARVERLAVGISHKKPAQMSFLES